MPQSSPVTLSLPEARRLAIASQGFGARNGSASIAHVRKLAARIHAFQIDSVNVFVRAHYVPAFARLGRYRTESLDTLAYQKRELFEYWGHEASLMPLSLYPLVRYRMDKHRDHTHAYMRTDAGRYMAEVYHEIAERGPLAASELSNPGEKSKGWWSWWGSGNGKATLEHLYDAGLVAIAGRRVFQRLYDLPERVIPRATLDRPVPPREEAMKQLICLGAQAYGVGTLRDLAGYFHTDGWRDRLRGGPPWLHPERPDQRRASPIVTRLVSELVEEGRLVPARVEGWSEPAYLHPKARAPREVEARAVVTPFDSLVWERGRIDRLFGMKYTIEIYTPAEKRIYGYYVCPFLLGDRLVARCDLKADRVRSVLMLQSAHLEPGQRARDVAPELAEELRQIRDWLGLDRIEVVKRGDLAAAVGRAIVPAAGF